MNWNNLKKHDWVITLLLFFLVTIGTLIIFSTTYRTEINTEGSGTLSRQIFFIVLGFAVYFVIGLLDLQWLRQPAVVGAVYLVTILLLVYLVLFGEEVASTQRWIQLGFINIQPSEIAKLTVIIFTAYIFNSFMAKEKTDVMNLYIEDNEKPRYLDSSILKYVVSFALLVPVLFLIFIQPALGNTLILLFLWLMLAFVIFPHQSKLVGFILFTILTTLFIYKVVNLSSIYSIFGINLVWNSFDIGLGLIYVIIALATFFVIKLNPKLLLIGFVIGLIIYPTLEFGWNRVLQDYHRERVTTFLNGPENDRYDGGYQVIQSQIALGSGKFNGRGFLQGSQSSLRVLDFAHTDFIFASLGEQFGFIGTSVVLVIYIVLLVRIISVAKQTKDTFMNILAVGVCVMLLLNIFINIGMNMGILPVTGVPLPFVSYGGSSILVNMFGMGLIQAIRVNTKSIDISEKVLVVS